MSLHVATGYRRDERNRLVAINDWEQRPVPRFWLGRTAESVIWRFGHDLPDSIVDELDALACTEKPLAENRAPAVDAAQYQSILDRHRRTSALWHGPVYWFASVPGVRAGAIPVSSDNEHLLHEGLAPWGPDVPHQQPMLIVVAGGKAVSVCASVRKSAAAHAAGVETRAEYRGRGHALTAVVGWVRAVQETGRVALYSTSWTNEASQRLAVKAGATFVGEELHFT